MKAKVFYSKDVTWYSNKGKVLCYSTRAVSDTIAVLKEEIEGAGFEGTPNNIKKFCEHYYSGFLLGREGRGVLDCYIEAGEGDQVHNWIY